MDVIGIIKVLNPTQEVSASFKKRELVITTNESYPQHILIEFAQDKCDLLNNYQVGQNVKVSINLRGREWVNPEGVTKYFNQIQGWRIEKDGDEQPHPQVPPPHQQEPSSSAPATEFKEEEHDDLPFN